MDDLVKKIPIELTQLLNNFNRELSEFRKEIDMKSHDIRVHYNSSEYNGVKIIYRLKKSSFRFEIEYLLKGDYLSWIYYPYVKHSTQEKNRARSKITPTTTTNELLNNLIQWKNNLVQVFELENPEDYFKIDDFIKFYAGEIIERVKIEESDYSIPLSSDKQELAITIINKQLKFIEREFSNINDKEEPEKKNDLTIAKNILDKLKSDIPRMTIAEVKNNWSISLGAIRKWCGERFVTFLKIDKGNGYDISRMIGSFIGGVLGVPKIEQ